MLKGILFIAGRVRESNIFCEIHPFNKIPTDVESLSIKWFLNLIINATSTITQN